MANTERPRPFYRPFGPFTHPPLHRPMSDGMRDEIRRKNTEYPKPSPV